MAMMMVAIKSVRSKPRRVWYAELKLSPPKAPPNEALVRCKSTAPTRRTAKTIWIYGRNGEITLIGVIIACAPEKSKNSIVYLESPVC